MGTSCEQVHCAGEQDGCIAPCARRLYPFLWGGGKQPRFALPHATRANGSTFRLALFVAIRNSAHGQLDVALADPELSWVACHAVHRAHACVLEPALDQTLAIAPGDVSVYTQCGSHQYVRSLSDDLERRGLQVSTAAAGVRSPRLLGRGRLVLALIPLNMII